MGPGVAADRRGVRRPVVGPGRGAGHRGDAGHRGTRGTAGTRGTDVAPDTDEAPHTARERGADAPSGTDEDGGTGAAPATTSVTDLGIGALVAVWLGGLAFDLFSGTRSWVDLAGTTSGWARTGRASVCLLVAVAAAGLLVAATVRLARRRTGTGPAPTDRAVVVAWLASTAGAVVAHGLPLLLLDGQFVLALASDPFGRGWDLFGTADRTIDYSPLSPGLVGGAQIVIVAAGGVWGVVAAARALAGARRRGLAARDAGRALWATGVALAAVAATVVALLAGDLE